MRPIEFRGWRDDPDWEEPYMEYADEGETLVDYIEGMCVRCSHIMQYTGLLDKNGAKIFEGDIVRYNIALGNGMEEQTGEVKWRSRGCAWMFAGYLMERTPRETIEVIGNIYENPDLLKGGEK